MIVYLATYPRSGNALLQQILAHSFRILPSSIKAGRPQVSKAEGWDIQPVAAGARMATYLRMGRRYPYVLPGPEGFFTLEQRSELAAAPELFVIKTHALPRDEPLPGERVVQIVRHPGAVLWSYFRYEADRAQDLVELRPVTLERVIEGDVLFGDWSVYHQAWTDRLSADDLRVNYETVVSDLDGTVKQLASYLDLSPVAATVSQFEEYRARQPGKDVRGRSEGYERFYTASQLDLLWKRHGSLAAQFGFSSPEIGLACPHEQIARLVAQMR